MNKQQTYQIVRDHLLTQMECSVTTNGCAYRGPSNTACAIGVLLPNALAKKCDQTEDSSIKGILKDSRLAKQVKRVLKITNNRDVEFLEELQGIHDNADKYGNDDPRCGTDNWPEDLYNFAQKHSLQP